MAAIAARPPHEGVNRGLGRLEVHQEGTDRRDGARRPSAEPDELGHVDQLSANLQTQLKTSFKAGALIGRGSGEAVQVSFYGQGFVIVQPSEGIQITSTA